MKFLQGMILSLFLLLLVPSLVVESSSLNDTYVTNITRGSCLYSNGTSPYWLSPSGNLAFGFYQVSCRQSTPNCSDRYVVGIWFVKSPNKALVWTANPNDIQLRKPSSILFTSEGKMLLQIMPDNKEKPLIPDIQEPVSYAMMHDDDNFVLYGSHSQIVWESFDYPTDTILGGQKLKAGIDLISGGNRLSIQGTDGLDTLYGDGVSVISDGEGSLSIHVLLGLYITGELFLVGSDDVVLKYLYETRFNKKEVL